MPPADPRDPHSVLPELLRRSLDRSGLEAEMHRAAREFFGPRGPDYAPTPARLDAAERRFREWFLLERPSDVLGGVPVECVGDEFPGLETLEGSRVGVFLVEGVHDRGRVVEVRDLQDDTVQTLVGEPDGAPVGTGDLIVGRLYGDADGWRPSPAAARRPHGLALARAFHRDLKRLQLGRRLSQAEIEHLLFRPWGEETAEAEAARPLEHVEAELDRVLRTGGVEDVQATAVSAALQATGQPGEVMDPLLERLAFDSTADLARSQKLLWEMWDRLHPEQQGAADGAPTPADAPPVLGRALADRLEEGLARGEAIEGLFDELAAMAGMEPGEVDRLGDEGEETGDEEEGPVLGDLAGLVEEYAWERQLRPDDRAALVLWVQTVNNAPGPVRDLEEVRGDDLTRALMQTYLGTPPDQRVAATRRAARTLEGFLAWAAECQDVDCRPQMEAARRSFLDHVERIATASTELSSPAAPEARPRLLRVEDRLEGALGLRTDEDGAPVVVRAEAGACRAVRPGDLVLGAVGEVDGDPRLGGMVVVLPAGVERLLG